METSLYAVYLRRVLEGRRTIGVWPGVTIVVAPSATFAATDAWYVLMRMTNPIIPRVRILFPHSIVGIGFSALLVSTVAILSTYPIHPRPHVLPVDLLLTCVAVELSLSYLLQVKLFQIHTIYSSVVPVNILCNAKCASKKGRTEDVTEEKLGKSASLIRAEIFQDCGWIFG